MPSTLPTPRSHTKRMTRHTERHKPGPRHCPASLPAQRPCHPAPLKTWSPPASHDISRAPRVPRSGHTRVPLRPRAAASRPATSDGRSVANTIKHPPAPPTRPAHGRPAAAAHACQGACPENICTQARATLGACSAARAACHARNCRLDAAQEHHLGAGCIQPAPVRCPACHTTVRCARRPAEGT